MKRSFGEVNHSVNFNVANVLVMLSRGGGEEHVVNQSAPSTSSSSGRIFKCKTCCRQFLSFQALGGHRASHKKPTLSGEDNQAAQAKSTASAKAKAHECSICGLEFAIGQALGGHMRRHRAPTTEGFGHGFVEKKSSSSGKRVLLDLNLPPFEAKEGRRLGVELGLGLGLAYSLDSYI